MVDLRKKILGQSGEELAVSHLIKEGYEIIERNFSKRYGEIDIVAKDGQTLVFVEVKTRRGNLYGSGLEAIMPWKLKALIRSAQFYKMTHKNLPDAMRIDAVSVTLSPTGEVEDIELVKNITT